MSIEFTSRERVFEQNPVLARHVFDWQDECYNPSEALYEAGESVHMQRGDAVVTILTKEMADEINKETEEKFSALRDSFDPLPPKIKSGGQLYAELPYNDINVFVEELGNHVKRLFQSMGWDRALLISYEKTPYLVQENDYPPADQATKKLIALGMKPDFTGGVILDLSSMQEFCSHIFWIVRCNAMAPHISFAAPNSATVGSFCKYGNIHFEVYDEEENKRFLQALKKNKFTLPEDGMCNESFSDTSKLEGRKIDLG